MPSDETFECPACASYVSPEEELSLYGHSSWSPCPECGVVFDQRHAEVVEDA